MALPTDRQATGQELVDELLPLGREVLATAAAVRPYWRLLSEAELSAEQKLAIVDLVSRSNSQLAQILALCDEYSAALDRVEERAAV